MVDFGSVWAHNTYMMNERKNEMKVGDIVKSLDFPQSVDCYYIGKVVGIYHDGTFRAQVIDRVWLGMSDKHRSKKIRNQRSDYFVAPLPGHYDLDDMFKTPRVQVIQA